MERPVGSSFLCKGNCQRLLTHTKPVVERQSSDLYCPECLPTPIMERPVGSLFPCKGRCKRLLTHAKPVAERQGSDLYCAECWSKPVYPGYRTPAPQPQQQQQLDSHAALYKQLTTMFVPDDDDDVPADSSSSSSSGGVNATANAAANRQVGMVVVHLFSRDRRLSWTAAFK